MNLKIIAGSVLSYSYNHIFSNLPCHKVRLAYLKAYLGTLGNGTSVQMGCRFLNGRKVHLGDRNAQIKDILVAQKDGEKPKLPSAIDIKIF